MTTTWSSILKEESKKPYYHKLMNYVNSEYAVHNVFPEYHEIFAAIRLTAFDQVKVVILGQDPYFNVGQAMGLSFSVKEGVNIPPSLYNIFKELRSDIGCPLPKSGDLTNWGRQGVLLLNSVLTVRAGYPNSHRGRGWEFLTDRFIEELVKRPTPIVFILWGKYAQKTAGYIAHSHHMVIESSHPSPHSANLGFFGSKPFSRTNEFLEKNKLSPINWCLK